jgi:hypothetical protein
MRNLAVSTSALRHRAPFLPTAFRRKSNSPYPFWLLPACGKRPSGRRANNSAKEITSSHCLFPKALQQGYAPGEMGFNDKFALQKIQNAPCLLWVSLFSNSGRSALP